MLMMNDDWEFSTLGVYNYKKPGKLDYLIKFIRENDARMEGDIFEAGVFKGASIIALAMILKEIGSNKKIYGFDSFSGFPPIYHDKDELSEFDRMADDHKIKAAHLTAVKKNIEWRKCLAPSISSGVSGISTSMDFSSTSLDFVKRKINIIGLDNIILLDGVFSNTMTPDRAAPKKIFAGIVDCDLYQSYIETYNFIWPRLEEGAVIYLDEYYSLKYPGARRATDEFIQGKSARLEMSPRKPGDFERWHLIKK
jgi:hypothetical protein